MQVPEAEKSISRAQSLFISCFIDRTERSSPKLHSGDHQGSNLQVCGSDKHMELSVNPLLPILFLVLDFV